MNDKSAPEYKVIYVDAEHHKLAKMLALEMGLSVKDAVEKLLDGDNEAVKLARKFNKE